MTAAYPYDQPNWTEILVQAGERVSVPHQIGSGRLSIDHYRREIGDVRSRVPAVCEYATIGSDSV